MRTLVESILDSDFDVHDEAVFTDQIIPEIRDHTQLMLQAFLKDMTIKIENGNRILDVGGKNSFLAITDEISQILEKYNIHEIRSEGRLTIHTNLTGFNISAPNIKINSYLKDHVYAKCNITCDTLSIGGLDDSSIECNRCKIKVKTYEINRTPIEFVNSKVIGLNSVQIFLESDLFFAGQRPAVNVGLSVSRVGGAAQTKAMKKAAGSLRLDLAQYREMEIFTQFSSDLDETTKKQLVYGQGLMMLLRQPNSHPFKLHEQVIILVAATAHCMQDVPVDKIPEFRDFMLNKFHVAASPLCLSIDDEGILSDDAKQEIIDLAKKCQAEFLAENN